jgi:antitoxin HicB
LLFVREMKFRFLYQIDSDGVLRARCLDFFSCMATGKSLQELKVNASRELHRDLTVPPHTRILLTPRKADPPRGNSEDDRFRASVFIVAVRPGAAFALSLREIRTERVLFQRQVSRRLGMQLSAYQRLEDPLRANPTLETVARVQKVFPALNISNLFEPDA